MVLIFNADGVAIMTLIVTTVGVVHQLFSRRQ